MKRRVVCGMILTLFLVNILALTFSITPVKASGTIYIRADGSVEGTDKIQQDGDIYAFTNNIYDEIVVEKSNITIDGRGYTLQGSGSGEGFYLGGIESVVIQNTNIENFSCGVLFLSSSFNTLSGNRVTNNGIGVSLDVTFFGGSSNNTFFGNNITNNTYGIWLVSSLFYWSSNNTFYHNNFIDNTYQVWLGSAPQTPPVNSWDDGYPSGGNYWSDYDGIDSDRDGIGDMSYVIDENNIDNYPLMNPYWSPYDINHDLRVDMKDLRLVAKAFGSHPGNPRWNPIADNNGDNRIDMKDIRAVAKHFGETYI